MRIPPGVSDWVSAADVSAHARDFEQSPARNISVDTVSDIDSDTDFDIDL